MFVIAECGDRRCERGQVKADAVYAAAAGEGGGDRRDQCWGPGDTGSKHLLVAGSSLHSTGTVSCRWVLNYLNLKKL